MATLLNAVTTTGKGTGATHTGPCIVVIRGTFDGATVSLEAADEDVNASYCPLDRTMAASATARGPLVIRVDGEGTYYLRANVNNAGDDTEITAVSLQ